MKNRTPLQSSNPCPKCGEYALTRSRSKHVLEKIVKALLPLRTYRCHHCHWRGWRKKQKPKTKGFFRKMLLFYILVLFIAIVVAYVLRFTMF